jgi:hypothetical protein
MDRYAASRVIYAIGIVFYAIGAFGGHAWAAGAGLAIELVGVAGLFLFRRSRRDPRQADRDARMQS